jgi:hypothetical protein
MIVRVGPVWVSCDRGVGKTAIVSSVYLRDEN